MLAAWATLSNANKCRVLALLKKSVASEFASLNRAIELVRDQRFQGGSPVRTAQASTWSAVASLAACNAICAEPARNPSARSAHRTPRSATISSAPPGRPVLAPARGSRRDPVGTIAVPASCDDPRRPAPGARLGHDPPETQAQGGRPGFALGGVPERLP